LLRLELERPLKGAQRAAKVAQSHLDVAEQPVDLWRPLARRPGEPDLCSRSAKVAFAHQRLGAQKQRVDTGRTQGPQHLIRVSLLEQTLGSI
jgi:hypothetical protein